MIDCCLLSEKIFCPSKLQAKSRGQNRLSVQNMEDTLIFQEHEPAFNANIVNEKLLLY